MEWEQEGEGRESDTWSWVESLQQCNVATALQSDGREGRYRKSKKFVVKRELHSSDKIGRQGKKDQRPSSNSGPTLYRGVLYLLQLATSSRILSDTARNL